MCSTCKPGCQCMKLVETMDNNPEIDKELSELPNRRIRDLRTRWRELFRADPPPSFGLDLLRRSIAHRIQERNYGGLRSAVRRELDELIKILSKKPSGKFDLPRRIKSGAVLVREWKGQTHKVIVSDGGFTYNGNNFSNLSKIAREITGTRWNGPRFFGLRKKN